MADFCYDCTLDAIAPEYADRNDMRHNYPTPKRQLCEGCGVHEFWPDGSRIHHGYDPETPMDCSRCQHVRKYTPNTKAEKAKAIGDGRGMEF